MVLITFWRIFYHFSMFFISKLLYWSVEQFYSCFRLFKNFSTHNFGLRFFSESCSLRDDNYHWLWIISNEAFCSHSYTDRVSCFFYPFSFFSASNHTWICGIRLRHWSSSLVVFFLFPELLISLWRSLFGEHSLYIMESAWAIY